MAGGSASSLEAIEATVELRVREYWLDGLLAFSVERLAEFGFEDAAHERIRPAVPAGSGAFAFVSVWWDEDSVSLCLLLEMSMCVLPGAKSQSVKNRASRRCS